MEKNVFFSATMQKSPMSISARVMTERGLERVVYFVLRGGSEEQREELAELVGRALIERVPLKKARREMWVCRTYNDLSDADHLLSFEDVLHHVFGEKCRVRVRIMWKGGVV